MKIQIPTLTTGAIIGLAAAVLLSISIVQRAVAQDAPAPLWQIGQQDHDDKEFALAPGNWGNYKNDAMYVIGVSKPGADWPYVQPGPVDAWAGGQQHTNNIFFNLSAAPAAGSCSLDIYLVDSQGSIAPQLNITVDGQSWTKQTILGGGDSSLNGNPSAGKPSTVAVEFPSTLLHTGLNTVTITTVQGSWIIYDAVSMTTPPGAVISKMTTFASIQSAQWLHDVLALKDGQYQQVLELDTINSGNAGTFNVYVSGEGTQSVFIPAGKSTVQILYPESSGYQRTQIELTDSGLPGVVPVTADREPCKRYTIYEIEHSHMDIGYRYVQQDALNVHTQDIKDAFGEFAKTAAYPVDSRFRWNCESLVETDAWLKSATPEQIVQFKQAVRNGYFGLAALYCNELTGLCRPEELVALLADANELRTKYGIPIDSAMISDVPGYTWGMVPMLAESGIKYFSWGPNPSDHLGEARDFDNQAFYWVSPSGRDKVLVWQTNNGYQTDVYSNEQSLVNFLSGFDQRFPNDPYTMICDRHTIADNGPIDPSMPEFVRDWNGKYAYPHIVIATNSQMFHEFEKRYGATLPELHGDYTGYWEDGAASSAAETTMNRNAGEMAAQAEILWSMIEPSSYPFARFDDTWKQTVLYDEHTWGADESWNNPESAFTKAQWAWKRQYAVDALSDASSLTSNVLAPLAPNTASNTVAVFNTSTWPRTEVVEISPALSSAGDKVQDENGNAVPSQRLADGTLAFLAKDVLPLSSTKFKITAGTSDYKGAASATATTIANGTETLTLDPDTGAIVSWKVNGIPQDLVNLKDSTCRGLNDYLYVLGDDNSKVTYASGAKITVIDPGPLVATVKIDSAAPGCNSLSRTLTVTDGQDAVNIDDTLDKQQVRDNEGVHIGFNFNVPNCIVHLDEPWSVVRPDIDQTVHANKAVLPVGRWADVSNDSLGVTCANLDNPMMEVGAITSPRENEGGWIDTANPGSTLYWNLMNNYWHTNYKAYQSGVSSYRYAIVAHGPYDQAAAQRFGIGQSQPLVVVAVAPGSKDYSFPLTLSNQAVILTSCRPVAGTTSWLLRLFNCSDQQQTAKIDWSGHAPQALERTDLWGNPGSPLSNSLALAPMEIATLKLTQ